MLFDIFTNKMIGSNQFKQQQQ